MLFYPTESITMRKHAGWLSKKMIRYVVLMIMLSFSGCSHMGDWGRRIDWKEIDFEHLPGEKEYPDAGAVILLDDGSLEIYKAGMDGLSVFERHRIVKILNPRGHRYLNVAIPYSPDSRVDDIQARTVSPDGKITVLDKEDIFDITFYPFFVFYSDRRAKLFALPAVENGSIIEYRYRVNIRTYTFWHGWQFQDTAPTLLSRFTLVEPSEWDVHYRVYGMELEPQTDINPPSFKNTYTWEARDVPPLKTEFGMPPTHKTAARLVLAPIGIEAWDDVAAWYYRLAEPRIAAGSGIKARVSQLTEGVTTEKEKLRRIYDWVRDHIRYIAVSIGIGGFQPHPAEEILNNRYGDCKDMTTLLCAMVREADINAYEVLISTRQNGMPDTTLPSQLVFNHAIAYCPTVGDSGIWMDATAKGCPFGQLPWYDQGLPVLVVGDGGKASLPTTPRLPPDSNRTLVDWHVILDSTGMARIEGTSVVSGAPAVEMREEFITSSVEERQDWLERWLARRCPGVTLDSFRIEGIGPVEDPLQASYTFRAQRFAIRRPGELVFSPGTISSFDLADYFRADERVHPIQFMYGHQNELHMTVDLPAGWTAAEPVWFDSLSSPFGSATWSWHSDSIRCHVQSVLCLEGEDILPNRYAEFRDFMDNKSVRDLRQVVLKKK